MTVTKELLIKYIREKTGFQLEKCRSILGIVLNEIETCLLSGREVKISGFGKWKVKKKGERRARHPDTGEFLKIRERTVVLFSPGKKLRQQLNQQRPRDRNENLHQNR